MRFLSLCLALACVPIAASAQTSPSSDPEAAAADPVQERSLRFSVQTGVLSSTFAGDGAFNMGRKAGLNLAVFGQYDLHERPYFARLGVSYDQLGASEGGYDAPDDDYTPPSGDFLTAASVASSPRYDESANYLRVRLLGGRRVALTNRPLNLRAGAGPDVGLLVGSSLDGGAGSPMRNVDAGLAGVVEVGIPSRLLSWAGEVTVGLDAYVGLTGAADPLAFGGDRLNRAIGLKVGFLTGGRSRTEADARR